MHRLLMQSQKRGGEWAPMGRKMCRQGSHLSLNYCSCKPAEGRIITISSPFTLPLLTCSINLFNRHLPYWHRVIQPERSEGDSCCSSRLLLFILQVGKRQLLLPRNTDMCIVSILTTVPIASRLVSGQCPSLLESTDKVTNWPRHSGLTLEAFEEVLDKLVVDFLFFVLFIVSQPTLAE